MRLMEITIGKRYGRLVLLRENPRRRDSAGRSVRTVSVRCDCGVVKDALVKVIVSGNATSCGCKAKPHGHASHGRVTRAFRVWSDMRNRCMNPGNHSYAYYGGRGIGVCGRWSEFINFLVDMGEPPAGMQIDRIDNGGNYEPSNCRWATVAEQCRNRRSNIMVKNGDETMCLKDYCAEFGLNYKRVHARYRSAMLSIDEQIEIEQQLGIRT